MLRVLANGRSLVVYARGQDQPPPREQVHPLSRDGKTLGLEKVSYFKQTEVVTATDADVFGMCPPGLFIKLLAVVGMQAPKP